MMATQTTWGIALLSCLLLLGAASCDKKTRTTSTTTTTPATPASEDATTEEVFSPFAGQRFDAFDWRLCKKLESREKGNMVVSPIGVKIVLAMLYEGATGKTANEIRNTLELSTDRQEHRERFGTILTSLQATQNMTEIDLEIGTKLYVDKTVQIRDKFATTLKTYYNSEVEQVDFSQPAEAAKKINSWVDSVTNGHIQNLVTEGDSMASKIMLLINAIYFKGYWRYPFDPKDTRPGRFHVSPTQQVEAQYMRMSQNFYFYESEKINAKLLRIPYMGKKFAMFIVLPNDPNGLSRLLNTVSPNALREHMWLMESGNTDVILPKFSFKFTADLSDALKELGIVELFGESATLGGVVKGSRQPDHFFVSDVLQKAGLEVGEQGTTAYAVTSVSLVNKLNTNDFTFNATHPFMFYIEDEEKGTVIFVGKVVDPSRVDKVGGRFPAIPPPSGVTPTRAPRPTPSAGLSTEVRRVFGEAPERVATRLGGATTTARSPTTLSAWEQLYQGRRN